MEIFRIIKNKDIEFHESLKVMSVEEREEYDGLLIHSLIMALISKLFYTFDTVEERMDVLNEITEYMKDNLKRMKRK